MTVNLPRLLVSAVVVALGILGLWQAGILFSSPEENIDGIDVQPANASIETPTVPGLEVGLQIGRVAPDFEFSTYEGERVRFSDFRGAPVLINFWATWCLPCFTEMPAIDEAKRRYESEGLAVIAMNKGERLGVALDWLEEQGLEFTAFGYDPEESVYRRYTSAGMQGLPISFFLDAEGVITDVVYGPLRESDLGFSIERAIQGYQAPVN